MSMEKLVDAIRVYCDVIPKEITDPSELIDGSILTDETIHLIFTQYVNETGIDSIEGLQQVEESVILESCIVLPSGSHWVGYVNHKDEDLAIQLDFSKFQFTIPPKSLILVPNHPIYTLSFAEDLEVAQIHYTVR